ncbi:MAG: hypothetical protein HKN96_02375, partial [Flavobacteriaceae bacterium]|nr:hypothetical protein [Flavobacteriaceae bacterium]
MKKLLIIGLAVSTIAFVNCKKTTTESSIKSDQIAMNDVSSLDVDKELDAIMAVIKSETECFFSRDYDCWKKNWVTEDHVALTWNVDDGTFEANIGWDAISKSTLKHFKEHPLGGVPS